MPPETVFVTLHIHTDGPIPGPHSLLTLSSAAHQGDGGLIGTFTTNVRELPGATLHPVSLQHWRARAEDWLTTRRASRPGGARSRRGRRAPSCARSRGTAPVSTAPCRRSWLARARAHDSEYTRLES